MPKCSSSFLESLHKITNLYSTPRANMAIIIGCMAPRLDVLLVYIYLVVTKLPRK